jgi:hypothetical protein
VTWSQVALKEFTAEEIMKSATTDCSTSSILVTSGALTTLSSGTSSGVTTGSVGVSKSTLVTIHGILAGFIFALLFTFRGVMIRMLSFKSFLWAHGILQIIEYIDYLIVMGLEVYIALHLSFVRSLLVHKSWHECRLIRFTRANSPKTHPILGFVLVALLFLQGPLNCVHHVAYKKLPATNLDYLLAAMDRSFCHSLRNDQQRTWS